MGMKAVGAPVAATNVEYSESVSTWLRMHGKAVRPQLGKRQLGALRECFDIIDTDGTGKITAEELCNVFTALGDHVSLEAGARVLDTTKHHGSDGIGFPDFISIMTKDSQDLESGPQQGKADVTIAYNIAIMARAYRRKKVLESVCKDEGGWRVKFVQMHDRLKGRERQSHIRLLTEPMMPLGSQHSMQSTLQRASPSDENMQPAGQPQAGSKYQSSAASQPQEQAEAATTQTGQVAFSSASSSFMPSSPNSTRLGTGALSIITAAIVGGLPSSEAEEDQMWGAAQQQRLAAESSEEIAAVTHAHVTDRPALSAKAQQKLQALQAAADSVLTPRWQTELGTRQVHQHPFRSSLQYQAAQDTEVGIHQQPFSSSLQFQAAHDTDFHQQLDGDTLHRSARPDTAVSPAHAATVDPVSHNQVNQVDAAHAADVEFAAIYMRNHEMDSSRHVDCSDFRGAAASSSSGSSRMTQNKISPAVGNSQNGLESRMDSMAVHSVSSSSSNSTSSSDIGAASAHHSHGSSSPVAHSSRSDTHAADEARPATIGRVLGPRNAVDVAVRGSAATEAPSKHVSHAERAVGLVEPTAYTGTAPSLDIMIKTGHVAGTALSHLQYASPRSKLRQAAFLGHLSSYRRLAWNTSTKSRSAHQPLDSPLQIQRQQPTSSAAAVSFAHRVQCSDQRHTVKTDQQIHTDSPTGTASASPEVPDLVAASAVAADTAVMRQALHAKRQAVPLLGLSSVQHTQQGASSARMSHHWAYMLSNDSLSALTAAADMQQRPATVQPHYSLHAAPHPARPKSSRDPDTHQQSEPAGSLTRPRSSVWHNTAAEPNLLEGIDEGPVKSRTARAPLTAPALSPRAPWLQATALTAAKFRQPSRQQTARAVERAHMRVQTAPSSPGRNAFWQSSTSKRVAMQDRAVNAPVAFGQQIKIATQAQVRMLAEQRQAVLHHQ